MSRTATVHPINAGGADAAPPRARIRPNHVLPTDRIGIDKQLVLLRAYAAVSGQSKKPAKIADVADVASISATTVSLANGFLLEIGLLQKTELGFIPSEGVSAFALAHNWEPNTASHKLAPIISQSWFAQYVLPKLMMGPVQELQLINDLGQAAGVGPDFKLRIKILIDFLEVSGIAQRDGDYLKKTTSSATVDTNAPPPTSDKPSPPSPVDPKESTMVPRTAAGGRGGVNSAFTQMTGGAVQFNIAVKVDMEEFATWEPERITRFFSGIAAVLAAKAAVERSNQDE